MENKKTITLEGVDEMLKKIRRLNELLEEAEQLIGELKKSEVTVKY